MSAINVRMREDAVTVTLIRIGRFFSKTPNGSFSFPPMIRRYSSLMSALTILRCIEPGCRERGALRQWRYHAFVDPSGGSNDAMTLAIAHKEGNTVILDMVRERRPPFSPEAVVEEFANELKNYRITSVAGDRYAGEWPRERFRLHGVNYEVADKSKSELYVALLPSVNSRAVDLLDDDR